MTDLSISTKIRAGLNECARNQLAIPAREALTRVLSSGGEIVKPPAELRQVLALIAKIRLEQQREAARMLKMARLPTCHNTWRTRV